MSARLFGQQSLEVDMKASVGQKTYQTVCVRSLSCGQLPPRVWRFDSSAIDPSFMLSDKCVRKEVVEVQRFIEKNFGPCEHCRSPELFPVGLKYLVAWPMFVIMWKVRKFLRC